MDKNNFSEYVPYLKTACQKQGLKVTEEQIDLWLRYLSLLQKWNNAFNLTAITDPEQMVTHHILDSLSVQPWINHNYIIDVGTGAGFLWQSIFQKSILLCWIVMAKKSALCSKRRQN